MRELRYTLLSDGSLDKALLPLLTWLLHEHTFEFAIQSEWADLRRLPTVPRTLADRIQKSIELYPCDLLFVHRDAEREPHEVRRNEIRQAIEVVSTLIVSPPVICVVPIRMQEAWLLFDEPALRRAAGNPHGRMPLQLPRLIELENLPDPKEYLNELIREASGLNSHRRKKIPVSMYAQRVLEFIEDFDPLRRLSAFNALEDEIRNILREHGWLINVTRDS
jgi:hypothetical protein